MDQHMLTLGGSGPGHAFSALRPSWTFDAGLWLTATTHQIAVVFQAEEPIEIIKLAMRFSDWAWGSPGIERISLQGINAAGAPDGTIKADGAAKCDFTPTADTYDNKCGWFTLDTPYTATRGELLAIVLKPLSGNWGSGQQYVQPLLADFQYRPALPYVTWGDNTWTKRNYGPPCFGYASATRAYGIPFDTLLSATYNANSNPNEYALRFTLPTTLCDTYRIAGLRALITIPPATGRTFTARLYDTDHSTVLHTITVNADQIQPNSQSNDLDILFTDADLTTLTAGAEYSISLTPNQNDTALVWHAFTVADTDAMTALPFGAAWYRATRQGSGAWSTQPTTRPICELILDHITIPEAGPPADAIPNFPFVMLSSIDAKTPCEGLSVTAETMIDGADFVACTNAPAEKSDGVYLIDIDPTDQGAVTTLLKFTAPGALTQYATLVR